MLGWYCCKHCTENHLCGIRFAIIPDQKNTMDLRDCMTLSQSVARSMHKGRKCFCHKSTILHSKPRSFLHNQEEPGSDTPRGARSARTYVHRFSGVSFSFIDVYGMKAPKGSVLRRLLLAYELSRKRNKWKKENWREGRIIDFSSEPSSLLSPTNSRLDRPIRCSQLGGNIDPLVLVSNHRDFMPREDMTWSVFR